MTGLAAWGGKRAGMGVWGAEELTSSCRSQATARPKSDRLRPQSIVLTGEVLSFLGEVSTKYAVAPSHL